MPAARGSLLTVFSEQVPTPSSIPQVRDLIMQHPKALLHSVFLCMVIRHPHNSRHIEPKSIRLGSTDTQLSAVQNTNSLY